MSGGKSGPILDEVRWLNLLNFFTPGCQQIICVIHKSAASSLKLY